MFRQVQKQLTLLYTALTSAILLSFLGILFWGNIRAREQAHLSEFQNLWQSVSSHMQVDHSISMAFLSEAETAGRAIIHIEENGVPFLFSGAFQPPTKRSVLIERGFSKAREENVSPAAPPVSSNISQTSLFHVTGDRGEAYYGRLMVAVTSKGSKSLLILAHITPRSQFILQSLTPFIIMGAAGVFLIFCVSFYLTGRSLQPAREAARQQMDFVAAASHELRSPLAVIRSSLSALKEELLSGETKNVSSLLSNADKECGRMARLVSDLLLLNSLDGKKWTLVKKELEIDTLMIETYESFLPLARENSVLLDLHLPEEPLPIITADKHRLEQILSILIDNALTYTPQGKAVTLTARFCKHKKHGRSRVELEVSDQGPGIPDEQKLRIFDRFFRGDPSRNDKKHFGLGLNIAKELTELHGGTVEVFDNQEGGSRFVVSLMV